MPLGENEKESGDNFVVVFVSGFNYFNFSFRFQGALGREKSGRRVTDF